MSAATEDFELVAGELASTGQLPQPGTWRSALYRNDAPGAELDGQPWARSWPRFMRAVTDPMDSEPRRFIAAVMTRPKNATFTERIPSEGGFLVPEYLRSQVMEYMTSAVMRPRAMVLPMGSLRLAVPNLDNPTQQSGTQALGGLEFSFVEEGVPIPATAPTFGRTVLEANKLAGLLANTPNELVEDAAGPLGDFLARVVPEGLSWYEDDLFIGNGTGTGQPQSLIDAPCAVNVARNTNNVVILPDLVAMFKALHPAAKQAGLTAGVTGVAWLLSATVLDQLLELYLYPADPSDPAPGTGAVATLSDWFQAGDGDKVGPSLLGLPALITDHQPALGTTGDVILADLRQYLIGDRLTMTIERSAKGPGFGSDTSDFRIRSRLDGRYWIQSATTTEAGQTVSPVVVLDTYS
jgi:HK97 family phage major capsid protein